MYSSDEDDFDVESSNSYHSLKRTVSLIAKVVPQLQSTQESSSSNQSNVSHWKREWKKRRVEIVAGVTGVLSGWLLKRQLLKQSTVLTTTSMCLLIFKMLVDMGYVTIEYKKINETTSLIPFVQPLITNIPSFFKDIYNKIVSIPIGSMFVLGFGTGFQWG